MLASESIIPSFIPFICKYGLLTKHRDQCGFICCEWRKPNSGYFKPKRYLLEGSQNERKAEETDSPDHRTQAFLGGLCSRNHMVKLNQDTAARFLFLQASHSPSPAPSSLISSLCSRGRVPGERVPWAHGSHATPWLQENRVLLNLHKGPGRRHSPKGGGGAVSKSWRNDCCLFPSIIMTPALGQGL